MLDALGPYAGPVAGIATSVLWTFTSLFFTAAGKRLGATLVNALRIWAAIVLLALVHRAVEETWLPPAQPGQWLLLAGSGLLGLAIGDLALFAAFVEIGPRLAMLVMTTAPLFAAFFGWAVLGESPSWQACLGIAVTLGGVAWVVSERPTRVGEVRGTSRTRGFVLAIVATACQAGGLLLSKQGMGHGWLPEGQFVKPLGAALLRMACAGVAVVPIVAWHRARIRARAPLVPAELRRSTLRAGLWYTLGGSIAGPTLGMWFSLEAADRLDLGVSQTLCSLPPVLVLPFSALVHKERITARAVLGAIIAVGGSAILVLARKFSTG